MTTARLIAIILAVVIVVTAASCRCKSCSSQGQSSEQKNSEGSTAAMADKVVMSDKDLKQKLTPEQYRVTQKCGTELPFSGKYYNFKGKGKYLCVACGEELFSSDTKYDSGTGWPSFYEPADSNSVEQREDKSLLMTRTEVRCARCGAHLGHVFEDGPAPTHLRYCINSAALQFADANDK